MTESYTDNHVLRFKKKKELSFESASKDVSFMQYRIK